MSVIRRRLGSFALAASLLVAAFPGVAASPTPDAAAGPGARANPALPAPGDDTLGALLRGASGAGERLRSGLNELALASAGLATGEEPTAKRIDAAGLPGYEYTVPLQKPKDGESRLIFLFKDKKEYEINCQSTPKLRERITEACDQAIKTLKVKK